MFLRDRSLTPSSLLLEVHGRRGWRRPRASVITRLLYVCNTRILEYMFVSFVFFLSEQTRAVLVYAGATRARVCVVQDTHCTYPYRRVGAVPARTCWLSRGRPWAEFESYTKQESRSLGAHSLSFVFFNCIRIADVCVCLPYSVRWQGMPLSCFFSLSALHVVSLT